MDVSEKTLKDMVYFGLDKSDIDSDGYVTLYHGTVKSVSTLKKSEIFFMTASKEVAIDYAKMRQKETGKKGVVQTIKVNPEDVAWNQGSAEIEFTKGGTIKGGVLYPKEVRKRPSLNKDAPTYRGIRAGMILPRTKMKVLDIVIHGDSSAQFKILNGTKEIWYDANTVIKYEFA